MKAVVCGIILVIVAGIAGCGGGGGSQSSSLTTLPAAIVGTYQVKGLHLPDDKLAVKANGDVVVNSDKPATKGSSQVKIGSCSPQGTVTLNGSWTTGGADYTINASGMIQQGTKSLSLQATVNQGNGVAQQATEVSGDKIDDMIQPPPPPDDSGDDGSDDMLPPPPPPDDSGNDDGGLLPPPPPPYD